MPSTPGLPISLTFILCKMLVLILTTNLVKHLDEHNRLCDLQHHFGVKRSCETQLTMLVKDFARNVSAGKQTDLILLNFSKDFDKVSHSKLLWKLHQYRIREMAPYYHGSLLSLAISHILCGRSGGTWSSTPRSARWYR